MDIKRRIAANPHISESQTNERFDICVKKMMIVLVCAVIE